MKSSVTINGVTLSRAQVEQAMKELQEPEFKPGDIVQVSGQHSPSLVISRELFLAMRHPLNPTQWADDAVFTTNGRTVDSWGKASASSVLSRKATV